MTDDYDPPEPDWNGCDWCERGSCGGYRRGYPKCGGPTGPGIDEPYDDCEERA
jgi:hypothetical protein